MFGGNSNWRGPIWFPTNFLLIQSLKRYHVFYGDDFKVECPTGSGNMMTLLEVARELERRLISIFEVGHDRHIDRHTARTRAIVTIPPGRIWFCSTNTSTPTPAEDSEPATKRAGPPWSRRCCAVKVKCENTLQSNTPESESSPYRRTSLSETRKERSKAADVRLGNADLQ